MVKNLKEQAFITVVIYVRNNEKTIADSLNKVRGLLINKFESYEIIVVNDASTDETETIIKKYAADGDVKKITLINLNTKHGLEKAMQAGVDFSIGDFVIELDSPELNYDINELYKLYEKSCEGYDIVSLQPKTKRRVTSGIFYMLFNKFSDVEIDFRTQIAHILTRRAINAISNIKDKTRYRKLLHVFSGYKKAIIGVKLTKKISSQYSLSEKIRMSSDILFSFSNLGMRINIYIALIFCLFSVFLGAYAAYQYLTYQRVTEGWTTIMLFLSFGFSGIFVILAIINKYFSITLKEIRTLPQYVVQNIEKL